jgi:hypothetical protein
VSDDTGHALGDTSERMLSTALYHADMGACPVQTGVQAQAASRGDGLPLTLKRHPARSNRLLLPR